MARKTESKKARRNRKIMVPLQASIALGLLLGTPGCAAIQENLNLSAASEMFKFDFLKKEAVQDEADKFESRYNSSINDMLSLVDNPDQEKAEKKRQQLIQQANALATQFENLSDVLENKVDSFNKESPIKYPGPNLEVNGVNILDKNMFKEKASEFESRYKGIVDDMVLLANDPDQAKIEEKRAKLVAEANSMATQFQALAKSLQNKLDSNGKGNNPASATSPLAGFDILGNKSFQQKTSEFQSRYTSIVDDMLSFIDDPDPRKAEEKRLKMVSEANMLASQFQDLAVKLESDLNTLTKDTKNLPALPIK